jgi:hypothetical protein
MFTGAFAKSAQLLEASKGGSYAVSLFLFGGFIDASLNIVFVGVTKEHVHGIFFNSFAQAALFLLMEIAFFCRSLLMIIKSYMRRGF